MLLEWWIGCWYHRQALWFQNLFQNLNPACCFEQGSDPEKRLLGTAHLHLATPSVNLSFPVVAKVYGLSLMEYFHGCLGLKVGLCHLCYLFVEDVVLHGLYGLARESLG